MECPLCSHPQASLYARDRRRQFYQCQQCQLVFVPPEQLPSADLERELYDYHINEPDDERYRAFLRQVTEPLSDLLASRYDDMASVHLLDFGSGPGPTLHLMMKQAGVNAVHYDPLYHADETLLNRQYDAITATEVVEHFHRPGEEFDRLFGQLLRSDGVLAIMTKPAVPAEQFPNWHYKNDLSHVCFYSEPCYRFIADRYGKQYRPISPTVAFFF